MRSSDASISTVLSPVRQNNSSRERGKRSSSPVPARSQASARDTMTLFAIDLPSHIGVLAQYRSLRQYCRGSILCERCAVTQRCARPDIAAANKTAVKRPCESSYCAGNSIVVPLKQNELPYSDSVCSRCTDVKCCTTQINFSASLRFFDSLKLRLAFFLYGAIDWDRGVGGFQTHMSLRDRFRFRRLMPSA